MLSSDQHSSRITRIQKYRGDFYDVKMNKAMPELTQSHNGKPSRLESMRADFQKRLLKEKEEKLIQMYEDSRRKAMARLTKYEPENVQNDGNSASDRKSVRDFFNERRRMEATGAAMPPIQNHYNLATSKKSSSRDGGSNLESKKVSFGGQRLQPLAPIQRNLQVQEMNNNIRPENQQKLHKVDGGDKDYSLLSGKAPLGTLKSIPSRHFGDADNSHEYADTNIAASRDNLQGFHKLPPTKQQPQSANNRSRFQPPDETLQAGAEEKLTDFQKWQRMNQVKTVDERYKKVNTNKSENNNEGLRTQIDANTVDDYVNNGNNNYARQGNNSTNDDGSRMKTNNREHLDTISGQQKRLDTVRKTRETEEEALEMGQHQRKNRAVGRGRENNVDNDRKNTKYWKQRGEKPVLERHEEESPEIEQDRQRKTAEKSVRGEDSRRSKGTKTKFRDENEEPLAKEPGILSSHPKDYIDKQQMLDQDPPFSNKQTSHFSQNSKRSQPSKAKVAQPDVGNVSLAYANAYEEEDFSNEAGSVMSDLAQCHLCGRSFLPERLKKHQAACAKANKPRKEFDSSKKRVEGTDLAKYASKAKRSEPMKKKSNWRAKHEEFIQSLQYARKVIQHEKEGLDTRQLTPPAVSKNPDYVPCPHCGRTFNVTAAERHIPRCQTLKTRPPPVNTRHR